jgi:hypothetical protein
MMADYLIVFTLALGALGLGNLIGDQATIRDCATKGRANMAGGGTVICEVKKDGGKE